MNGMLEQEVKELIIDVLQLEDIGAADIDVDAPLFVEGLGLDSIDALELGVALQKKYGISLSADAQETRHHFASVRALAALVRSHRKLYGSMVMVVISEMSRDELYAWVVNLLAEMFELDKAALTPESNLYVDLDIDSIDAVDLAVKLKQLTGKRLQPEVFKTIRTINDVVDALAVIPTEQVA
jgi:acyl carrier protein